MKKAFTMVELIFVIVVIGILAGVAIPRLAANRDDAEITKAKAQIGSIRAGIQTKRSANLLAGNSVKSGGYPESLDNGSDLFGNVLSPAIKERGSGDTGWSGGSPTYTYKLKGKTATFTYYQQGNADNKIMAGSFVCSGDLCGILDK